MAKFSESVKADLRKSYNWTCTICLNPLPEEGSHCAHIFAASKIGKEQVGSGILIEYPYLTVGLKVSDARSLGLLNPKKSHSRSGLRNGIIQCPTRHLEYFAPGHLVLSPPIPVLEWITQKLEDATDSETVWKIFSEFELIHSLELLRYKNNYSLIPVFSSDAETYEVKCNLPTISVVTDSGTFKTVSTADQTGQSRTFSYKNPYQRSEPGIVRFAPTDSHDAPTNYWYLPVPCHVILYFFLQRARSYTSERPEVVLARRIYAQLLNLRAGSPSQTLSLIMPVGARAESVSLEELSLAGTLSSTEDIELVPTDPPGSRPKLSPKKLKSHNPPARRTPSGRSVPTNPCCGQEKLNNTKTICTICFIEVPRSEYSTKSVIPDVVPEYKREREPKGGSETNPIIKHTLAGWMFSALDVTLPAFAAILAAGAIMGIFGTLILCRRV
ncbi:hypothetical protein C8R44DRAFT_893975 [Mycena epipterygia]|nr:hypothetical protein C8R44DRAFT_893975 [Mycena epipterygia]